MMEGVHVLPAVFMLVVLVVAMWYPGFMLSRNMIKALSLKSDVDGSVKSRKASGGEIVQCCIPVVNLGLVRGLLYGSAKIVYIPFGLTIFAVITRFILYLAFPNAIMLSFISLIFTWIMIVVSWVVNGYVLWDIGTCTQASTFSKILAFILPPLSQYIIGRNCVPMMRKAFADMEEAARQEDYVGNNH